MDHICDRFALPDDETIIDQCQNCNKDIWSDENIIEGLCERCYDAWTEKIEWIENKKRDNKKYESWW